MWVVLVLLFFSIRTLVIIAFASYLYISPTILVAPSLYRNRNRNRKFIFDRRDALVQRHDAAPDRRRHRLPDQVRHHGRHGVRAGRRRPPGRARGLPPRVPGPMQRAVDELGLVLRRGGWGTGPPRAPDCNCLCCRSHRRDRFRTAPAVMQRTKMVISIGSYNKELHCTNIIMQSYATTIHYIHYERRMRH